jgi:hypothetical protein
VSILSQTSFIHGVFQSRRTEPPHNRATWLTSVQLRVTAAPNRPELTVQMACIKMGEQEQVTYRAGDVFGLRAYAAHTCTIVRAGGPPHSTAVHRYLRT